MQKARKSFINLVRFLLLIGVAVVVIIPLQWAFAASFTPLDKAFEYAYPFSWKAFFPVDFTIEAYVAIFERGFGRSILNTLWLGIATVIIGGFICTSAGFAFPRFDFPGKKLLFLVVLITFTIPGDLTVIPRYIMVKDWGWINSWQALLVPLLANSLIIFMSTQFFRQFPQEIVDSARVDGASWFRVYFSIVLPISKPLLFSLGLILFLSQWDSYFWPLFGRTRSAIPCGATCHYRVRGRVSDHLEPIAGWFDAGGHHSNFAAVPIPGVLHQRRDRRCQGIATGSAA